ncbi:alpha/beta hydrolase [Horticoccus sp. 23ND18S-11]|uniref:alpha/beta hydrolase n=1 Tax=Horticoccus sp. 23ND18S-11 TaxID=3391832 RepID=UPI0039C97286
MPKYWMITNRNAEDSGLGNDRTEELSFYTAERGALTNLKTWTRRTAAEFRAALIADVEKFPVFPETEHERQKHVTVFVHGYNNVWEEAAARYKQITDDLYSGPTGLGICVLFTWPSNGKTAQYLADRVDARASGPALAKIFNTLFEHAMLMQQKAADGSMQCKAKVSVIAHSMGNWVLQNALYYTWERNNKPLLVSLINQCVMVAADVDNDLFSAGEMVSTGRAEGIANLCYRITALYSGRDSVLGVSAGLKHFGKRRLGRSGLEDDPTPPDNVWDFDCSSLFPANERNIHSAYFFTAKTQRVMRAVLQGHDRLIIEREFAT